MLTFDRSILTYDQFRVLMAGIEASQAMDTAARERIAGAGSQAFRAQLLILQAANIESTARQLFSLGLKQERSFGSVQKLVKNEIEARRIELDRVREEIKAAKQEQLA